MGQTRLDTTYDTGPEETARSLALTELDVASGGLVFQFKLVAVKTVSWAHDDETP
jgi:hypothetical protein